VLPLASLGAGGGLRREVRSIREALVLMGTQRLRQWAALLVLGRQASKSRTDALGVALVRARMCELLADRAGMERGFAFTAGLLSALDRLLGVPIAEVETRVDVDHSLSVAAFRHEGMMGRLVQQVTEYQDAVVAGEPTPSELGDVELVGAMAFAWAISHVRAIERTPR
jgi:c-di-GMP-related signal transduction protein